MASYTSRLVARCGLIGCLAILSLSYFETLAVAQNASPPSIEDVDEVMYTDPAFPGSQAAQIVVSNDAIALWMEALSRPEAELQRVAADTFAIAHRRGMEGVEVALPKLVQLAKQADLDPMVRRAAVKAIIEFDARDQAPLLGELTQSPDVSISSIAEAALVRWESALLVSQWLERIHDTGTSRQSLMHAIQGLGAIANQDASGPLSLIVRDETVASSVRMGAARALCQIHDSGLEPLATQMIDGSAADVLPDLLAVAMLRRHTSATSVELLKSLATRDSTLVQSESIARLYELDFNNVLEFADRFITSPDVNVRRTIARALIDSKDVGRIQQLASLLDDVNPGLRRQVASALFDLAQISELRDEVISQAGAVLDQDAWRGCEQAARVLVSLDHKPSGDRLVDLLRHPRGEVMVTAGWGLRRFGLKKHLPAMLGRVQEIYDGFEKGELNAMMPGLVDLVAQCFMAFGQMEYREADELVQAYLPKKFALGESSRAAAAWAIGFLHLGEAPDDLVKVLLGRLNDGDSLIPEYDSIRRGCAVSLGRMKAEAALPDLRKYATSNPDSVSLSCHWAVETITGVPAQMPTAVQSVTDYDDWFLKPISADALDE